VLEEGTRTSDVCVHAFLVGDFDWIFPAPRMFLTIKTQIPSV
jgi:hypothetical protein